MRRSTGTGAYADRTPHMMVMFFAEPGGLGALRATHDWEQRVDRRVRRAARCSAPPTSMASSRSASSTASASRRSTGSSRRSAAASSTTATWWHSGNFSSVTATSTASSPTGRCSDADTATAGLPAADGRARQEGPRPERHLSGDAAAASGRARLLAVRRTRSPTGVRLMPRYWRRRWSAGRRDGDPLVPRRQQPIPGIDPDPDQVRQNQFTFDDDPAGARCPFGAHVRRANPRNTDYPGRPSRVEAAACRTRAAASRLSRDDLMSSVRFHRILRRGREYGPGLSPEEALQPAPADEPERGLHFICLNANISRQFEFLQNAWLMSTKFAGLTGESDPLLGNRQRDSRLPGDRPVHAAGCRRAATARSPACRSSSPSAAAPISSCRACARCATWRSNGPASRRWERRESGAVTALWKCAVRVAGPTDESREKVVDTQWRGACRVRPPSSD